MLLESWKHTSSSPVSAAAEAVERGTASLDACDPSGALQWFERAHRLAPDDPVVMFLMAAAVAAQDVSRAVHLLDLLVGRYPSYRSAHISRAVLLERAGRLEEASCAIDHILCMMAVPRDRMFQELADRIALSTDCAGWVGLTGSGQVRGNLSHVHLEMDGERIILPRPPERRLADGWRRHACLRASSRRGAVLGSRIDLKALTRVEGIADLKPNGTLVGWAFAPNDPGASLMAEIFIEDHTTPLMTTAISDMVPPVIGSDGLMQPRGFSVALPRTALAGPIRVTVHGQALLGSPVRSRSAILAAHKQVVRVANKRHLRRVAMIAPDPGGGLPIPPRAGVDVIIPLFRGAAEFQACLASLMPHRAPTLRIVCVDDGIIEASLRDLAIQAADRGDIILLRHTCNLGFPTAINTGITHAGVRDVILLNSDTLLPPGAVARMADAAYADSATGTVTPLTTDGGITTCRTQGQSEPMPSYDALVERDRAASHANPGIRIEIPTCVGFCTYIRHDCLANTGKLQEAVFAQGYGEENDFSQRASQLGWRHVAACDVVVAHAGGRSFGAARHALLARNLDILNQLHPGYEALVAAFLRADPLKSLRRALARQEWSAGTKPSAIVLVTHAHGGGVERFVRARIAEIQSSGRRPIVIRPADGYAVSDGDDDKWPALTFDTANELAAFLRADRPELVEIHHLAFHKPGLEALAELLSVPFDITIHDYAGICAQITLCGKAGRYCGEPLDTEVCSDCVESAGAAFDMSGSVKDLRNSQVKLFQNAQKVSAPSHDTAARLRRYTPGCRIQVAPPQDDVLLTAGLKMQSLRRRDMPIIVAVVGALSLSKGYDVVLACAQDAERRDLPIRFHLVGHTIDDGRLLATRRVFVTGPFREGDAQAMLAAARPHLGFLPSVWPETWCYALSELWLARLPVVAFEIGSQAERIRSQAAGALLPLNAPAPLINNTLLEVKLLPKASFPSAERKGSNAPGGHWQNVC